MNHLSIASKRAHKPCIEPTFILHAPCIAASKLYIDLAVCLWIVSIRDWSRRSPYWVVSKKQSKQFLSLTHRDFLLILLLNWVQINGNCGLVFTSILPLQVPLVHYRGTGQTAFVCAVRFGDKRDIELTSFLSLGKTGDELGCWDDLDALVLTQLKQMVIARHNQRSASHLCAFYEFVILRIVGNDVELACNVNTVGYVLVVVQDSLELVF